MVVYWTLLAAERHSIGHLSSLKIKGFLLGCLLHIPPSPKEEVVFNIIIAAEGPYRLGSPAAAEGFFVTEVFDVEGMYDLGLVLLNRLVDLAVSGSRTLSSTDLHHGENDDRSKSPNEGHHP